MEGLRVADLVAAAFWPSDRRRVELVEIKVSAGDLRRETLAKSAPFVPYASDGEAQEEGQGHKRCASRCSRRAS